MELKPSISNSVEFQLPESARRPENARFIAFLKHYYDWLSAKDQPTDFILKLLEYRDIDLTSDTFRQYLAESLYNIIPETTIVDKKLLMKHLVEFLRSKGSFESFQFIMSAIYGDEIEMYWNSDKLLRPSANEYVKDAHLAVESNDAWTNIAGIRIEQEMPPASASIESCNSLVHDGKYLNFLTLDDKTIVGKFIVGQPVKVLHGVIDRTFTYVDTYFRPKEYVPGGFGAAASVTFITTSKENRDLRGLLIRQMDSDFQCTIVKEVARFGSKTSNEEIKLEVDEVSGTFGEGNLYVIPSSISNSYYTDNDFEYGIVSPAIVDVSFSNGGSGYVSGEPVWFYGGTGIHVEGYVGEVNGAGVDTIEVVKKGFGYSVGDKVEVVPVGDNGKNLSAEVSAIDGVGAKVDGVYELSTVALVNGGYNFKVNDVIEVLDGTRVAGVPPITLTVATVTSSWLLQAIHVLDSGYGYPTYSKGMLVDTTTPASLTKISNFAAMLDMNAGKINSVVITQVPTITHSNLKFIVNGYGATLGTITISSGEITAIAVTNSGINYINPVVVITGDGRDAVAIPNIGADGVISSITIQHGGTGYTTATAVIMERQGTDFDAQVIFRDNTALVGSVATLTITSRGEYTSIPNCFSPSLSVQSATGGANLELRMDFRLKSAKISDPGKFYQTADVSVDSIGTGAEFYPQLGDGEIVSFTISNGGTGYVEGAPVYVSGGAGFRGICNVTTGIITGIQVLAGGIGYTTGSTVYVSGGNGDAVITLTSGDLKDGVISSIAVLNGGHGYSYATTLSIPTSGTPGIFQPIIRDGIITEVSVIGSGEGYVVGDLTGLTVNAGTASNITATVAGAGKILTATILSGGGGYYDPTEVTPISFNITTSGGLGAEFIPTVGLDGTLQSVDVVYSGSGYSISDTIAISGGNPSVAATLDLIVVDGIVTRVDVLSDGAGYQAGTSILCLGDGTGAVVTPIVETGITKIEVLDGGTDYTPAISVAVTDANRIILGGNIDAILEAVVVDGVIQDIIIKEKGNNYVTPVIQITDTGTGANIDVYAERFIKSLTVSNGGSGYTYADLLVIGDGEDAEVLPNIENMGSVNSITLVGSGTGYVTTPIISIKDNSGFGAVSGIKITNRGESFTRLPHVYLPEKLNISDVVIAGGTKLIPTSNGIGSIKSIYFKEHGGGYSNVPTPYFNIKAQVYENAYFKEGEQVIIKNREDTGVTATVKSFNFASQVVELEGALDDYPIYTEDGKPIISESEQQLLAEHSGTFDVGDVIEGIKSKMTATIIKVNKPVGECIKGSVGFTSPSFASDVGLLNNLHSVVADNQRYQDYAYVIKAGLVYKDYEPLLKKTVHLAGFMGFGDVVIQSDALSHLLEEIGQNRLITTIFILSMWNPQYETEWRTTNDVFGDYNKFRYSYPIDEVSSFLIHETSKRLYANVVNYHHPIDGILLAAQLPTINSGNSVGSISVQGDTLNLGVNGLYSMYKMRDASATVSSYFYTNATAVVGNRVSLEMICSRQTGTNYFARFEIGAVAVHINLNTGTIINVSGTPYKVECVWLGPEFWYIRLIVTSTTTNPEVRLYPAYGYINNTTYNSVNYTGMATSAPQLVGSFSFDKLMMVNLDKSAPAYDAPALKIVSAQNNNDYSELYFKVTDDATIAII